MLREAFHERVRYELELKQKQEQERQQRYQHDLDRRLHPRTKDDFDVLYAVLESKSTVRTDHLSTFHSISIDIFFRVA